MQTLSGVPENQSSETPNLEAWMKIGQSFISAPSNPPKRKNIANYLGEDLIEQSKKFFNVDKRKSAADFIDDGFSGEEEDSKVNEDPSERGKAFEKPGVIGKKIKKKKKPKRKKNEESSLVRRKEPAIDFHKVDLLYKHKLKSHLLPITIMRFSVEDNYKYGLKTHEVPKFRRVKKNIILGLRSDKSTQAILDELNAIQGINAAPKKDKMSRFFEIPENPELENLHRPPEAQSTQAHVESFISLTQTQISEVREENPLVFSLNRSQISAKEDEFLQETKRFNELLQKSPGDLSIWLDFVNFQKKMFFYLPNSNRNQQTIIEKQLNIVEKALDIENLKSSSLLILLRIKLLKDANKGEDFHRICEAAWNEYIEKNPKNPLFWNLFFNFKFTNFIKFSASVFREESDNMLKMPVSGEILAALLKNICFVEKEMGYVERSIGIFQALIEFNLFGPKGLSFPEKLVRFQQFWESKVCIKTGEIDNFNGWEDSLDHSKETVLKSENQRSFLGRYEEIIRETRPQVEANSEISAWVEEELRNSEEWRPKKLVNEHTNIESVILFEDIEPFIRILETNADFSGEILNNFLDLLGFPPLARDLFPKIEDNSISEFYYWKVMEKLKEIQKKTVCHDNSPYLSVNNLDFYLRFWPLTEKTYLRRPFDELKIEYVRRFMHQIYRKWPVDEVLFYIFFLEGQFYLNPREDSLVFSTEKAKKARNSFKAMLKNNEANASLWVIYAEIEYLKSKNLNEAKKVYETILRVMDNKKKFLVLYFYCGFLVRSYNEQKPFQKETADNIILDNLRNVLLILDSSQGVNNQNNAGSYNYENKVFLLKFAAKKLENDLAFRLKKEKSGKKSKKTREILSKKGLILFFLMLSLSYSNFQEFCEILKKIEFLRLYYLKKSSYYPDTIANNNEIQLLFVNFCRLFCYQIRFYGWEDEQNYLRIVSGFSEKFPNNAILVNEILLKCDRNTLRINRIPKLKEFLNCKYLNLSIWLLYLHKEMNKEKEWESNLFLKRISALFSEMTKEEECCPLQRAISRLEAMKTNEIPPENLMSNLTKIFKLNQEFSEMLEYSENSKINLYSLHRIPFCKDLYLKHLKSMTKNREPLKEGLKLILSKEFRFYREPSFF